MHCLEIRDGGEIVTLSALSIRGEWDPDEVLEHRFRVQLREWVTFVNREQAMCILEFFEVRVLVLGRNCFKDLYLKSVQSLDG